MVKKRFPAVPTIAVILKVVAVLFLILGSILLVWQVMQASKSPMSGFKWSWDIALNVITGWFEKTVLPSALAWAAAEIILAIRDIEFNTRYALVNGTPAAAKSASPAPGTVAPEKIVPSTPPAPETVKPDKPIPPPESSQAGETSAE